MNFAAAPLYGVSSAVLVALLLATLRGGLDSMTAGISLAAGLLTTAASLWNSRSDAIQCRRLSFWEWASVLTFALFSLRAFLWLVFRAGDEIRVLSPNNLGDLSLHLTYIHHLANGGPFWPDNPIVAGAELTYPLGIDLFNSLLVLVGCDVLRGLIWVGLAGCALTGFALWRWGGAFTLFGFLANGGLAGFVIFRTGELLDFQSQLAWKSFFLALLVTQRGLLFALPAGLLLLCSWRSRFFDREKTAGQRLPLWGEVLLYGTMPIFHLHTFLFLSLVLLAWFIAYAPLRRPLFRLVALAFIPAAALTLRVADFFRGPSLVEWNLGWMQNEPDFLEMTAEHFGTASAWVSVPFFWLLNFGVLPFFVIALCILCARKAEAAWTRAAVFPALAVFVLCCIVQFAPWAWDNTKMMVWSYLMILPFIWSEVIRRWPQWLRAVACFGLFWSGFVSTLGGIDGTHKGFPIAYRSELDGLRPALQGIAPTERFIAHPNYNHPLLLLGRPLVLGYTGHVWSHGYPWQEQAARIQSILEGEPGWKELATATGARYLFWGIQEEEAYPASPQPWRNECRLAAEGDWGRIYDLTAPTSLTPGAALETPSATDSSPPPPPVTASESRLN